MNRRTLALSRSSVVLAALLLAPALLGAQQPAPQASEADFGLLVPTEGAVRQGEGRCVTLYQNGKEVVGKVHVDIGDRRLVILPNGRLVSVPMNETRPTSSTFTPATHDEIAAEMTGGALRGFKTRKTARYLYVYNTSEEFAKATSTILETMYPGIFAYFKGRKFPVHAPEMPLVVIMFKTEDEFQKYHEMPSGVVAYYSGIPNHVVMYEQSKLLEVAPELAVSQSISTIAHEGVHQILHNIGVQQRLAHWPIWISEGLAEYFAPTSTGKRLRWKGVGEVNDMRMFELERFLKQGSAQKGDVVSVTVGTPSLSSTGYAAAWALTHYLASRKADKFSNYVSEISKSVPFGDRTSPETAPSTQRNLEIFGKHFGSDYVGMESDLIKHLQKQPYTNPILNQTHYVVVITVGGSILTAITSSPAAIKQLQEQTLASVPPNLRSAASMQIRPFPNRDAAVSFANQMQR